VPYPSREVLWNHIQRHHGKSTRLNVSSLEESLLADKHSCDRNWVVRRLKAFDAEKLGTFYTGRRGRQSRIHWQDIPEKMHLPERHTERQVAPAIAVLDHVIPLRQGVNAKVSVPQDLTRAEAERLIEFIRFLPIEVLSKAG
jgi:hypothetical protein